MPYRSGVAFNWETVQHLHVEPTDLGAAITIADRSPGPHRVELRSVSADEVAETLARYHS